jgi:predicted amidohydrolase
MKVAVAIAQTSVTWDIGQNLAGITTCLAEARAGEIVVLPEACLSGYDDTLSGLEHIDLDTLAGAMESLTGLAADRGIHLFCGSLLFEDGAWWNAAIYLSPDGTRWTYRKVNLATHERGRLAAGAELPVLKLRLDGGSLAVGVQLCREIVFPEQWRYLAEAGAQAFVYLTNAVNPAVPAGVWSSHLISHAAANQRFVIACNIADPGQHCPSMIVSPRGEILGDLPAAQPGVLRTVIDTEDVSDWYLSQRRTDLLRLRYQAG